MVVPAENSDSANSLKSKYLLKLGRQIAFSGPTKKDRTARKKLTPSSKTPKKPLSLEFIPNSLRDRTGGSAAADSSGGKLNSCYGVGHRRWR